MKSQVQSFPNKFIDLKRNEYQMAEKLKRINSSVGSIISFMTTKSEIYSLARKGLFGSSFEDYQEQLIIILANQKPDVKLDQSPEFLLIDQGMWLMTQGRNTDEYEYNHLTLNEIRYIMDISLLY